MRSMLMALMGLAALACDPKPPEATVPDPPASSDPTPPPPTASTPAEAEAGPAPSAMEKTLFGKETQADCEGEGPRKCLQVRDSADGEWTLLYSRIKGFDYQEGFAYELRVRVSSDAHPPADGSSVRYELVKIVSQEKK